VPARLVEPSWYDFHSLYYSKEEKYMVLYKNGVGFVLTEKKLCVSMTPDMIKSLSHIICRKGGLIV